MILLKFMLLFSVEIVNKSHVFSRTSTSDFTHNRWTAYFVVSYCSCCSPVKLALFPFLFFVCLLLMIEMSLISFFFNHNAALMNRNKIVHSMSRLFFPSVCICLPYLSWSIWPTFNFIWLPDLLFFALDETTI